MSRKTFPQYLDTNDTTIRPIARGEWPNRNADQQREWEAEERRKVLQVVADLEAMERKATMEDEQ